MYQPSNDLSREQRERLDKLAEQFKSQYLAGEQPAIERWLDRERGLRSDLLARLILAEVDLRRDVGEDLKLEEYRRRFPHDAAVVGGVIESIEAFGQQKTVDQETVSGGSGRHSFAVGEEEEKQPDQIGRYEIRRRLGRGGFGIVYLAFDPQLNRSVALKVPRQARLRTAEQVDLFVREARAAANLKHPGLVSVYDVQEWDGRWYIVQEYVEGRHLGDWTAKNQPRYLDVAAIFVAITEALGAAHQHGLTHCDLKLANVLMDEEGHPHVADFGLAVHESARLARKGERFGTPYMMAPEQVRGEGHRLDGRTDIWAVGVMLYQLLTRYRPFDDDQQDGLFDQILTLDPKPPRQIIRSIPKELERICLKCLSKRRSDRYNTTDDLREDLLAWLDAATGNQAISSTQDTDSYESVLPRYDLSSKSKPPVRVIPKGLRSFDDDDADFFLELLPGPRDRHGIPDSVRFWKKRIEASDAESTFSVGLIYGPSGCGKSSLVKAGLLPRLGTGVLPIFLEATAHDTETRILHQLRKQIPHLESCVDLLDACTQLRRKTAGTKRKTLLVIDQFEQWLHTNKDRENTELAQALRQADGEQFQCLLLVRDDFWMSVTRFLRELEVALVEGHNLAAVDLFSERHACNVLTAFGRAFAALPEDPGEMTQEEHDFVRQAVNELAENGKVVSVRLALFAEMMKNRAWELQSLQEVGGARGVGEAFLEENLSSRYASPEHRLHEGPARSVLRLLLPEVGTQIRGHMRRHDELAEASGYRADSREFANLLRILDGELRLITPADPEGIEPEADNHPGENYYQLTHDYLVSSLQVWLTRKQRETRQGRAELRLEELAAAWNAKPERRNLPSMTEWAWFLKYTRRRDRSSSQNRMMAEATKRHTRRMCGWTMAVAVTIATLWFGIDYTARVAEQRRLEATVAQLWTSELSHLPDLIRRLEPRRADWRAEVESVAANDARSDEDRTRAHLALALDQNHPLDYLVERLLRAGRLEHQVILDILGHRQTDLIPILQNHLQRPEFESGPLIRSSSALALLGDPDQSISDVSARLVDSLIRSDPIEAARWSDTLVTVHDEMVTPLLEKYQDRSLPPNQSYLASALISDIARVSPRVLADDKLADVVMAASGDDYANLLPAILARAETVLPYFHQELERPVGLEMNEVNAVILDRQAIAAESIYRIGDVDDRSRFLSLLLSGPDPRLRTRLMGRLDAILGQRGLLDGIKREQRPSVRQAMVLALGESLDAPYADQSSAVRDLLTERFLSDADSGVHAACEWSLRRGGESRLIGQLRQQASERDAAENGWFVNSEGQTMIRIRAPGQFVVGSPTWEPGRDDNEAERKAEIPYDFAISAHEVTVRQFKRFARSYSYPRSVSPDRDCPITSVSRQEAIDYCRWLTEQERTASRAVTSGPEYEYALPTTAEWEYATRAGTKTIRFYGNDPEYLDRYAWYSNNSEERTHPVGLLRPNLLGLFDVYGNSTEWCELESAPEDADMPLRGGHYRATPKFLRSAMRVFFAPQAKVSIVGFRVVRRPVNHPAMDGPPSED